MSRTPSEGEKKALEGIARVIRDVLSERERQEVKHGPLSIVNLDAFAALPCLVEEVGEIGRAMVERDGRAYREECVHVAAVALAMIEAYDERGWGT